MGAESWFFGRGAGEEKCGIGIADVRRGWVYKVASHPKRTTTKGGGTVGSWEFYLPLVSSEFALALALASASVGPDKPPYPSSSEKSQRQRLNREHRSIYPSRPADVGLGTVFPLSAGLHTPMEPPIPIGGCNKFDSKNSHARHSCCAIFFVSCPNTALANGGIGHVVRVGRVLFGSAVC
jgi:hypothetical protein